MVSESLVCIKLLDILFTVASFVFFHSFFLVLCLSRSGSELRNLKAIDVG